MSMMSSSDKNTNGSVGDESPVPEQKATKSMHRSVKRMMSALICEVCDDVMVAPSTLPCGELWRGEEGGRRSCVFLYLGGQSSPSSFSQLHLTLVYIPLDVFRTLFLPLLRTGTFK